MTDLYDKARAVCVRFAEAHNLQFTEDGSIGFMRECVGFLRGSRYVEHNPYHPYNSEKRTVETVEGTECEAARPPIALVPNAYHKHDCFAVLCSETSKRDAVCQLASWVQHMERAGVVRVVAFKSRGQDLASFLDRTDNTLHAIVVTPHATPLERAEAEPPSELEQRVTVLEVEVES